MINFASVFAELLPIVRLYEGLRLRAYIDPVGVLTIGYGHTKGVKPGQVISLQEAESLLLSDATEALTQTLDLCPALATASAAKQAAIADFTFNLGAGRLRASTLRRRIEAGEYDLVPRELRRWVYGKNPKTGEMQVLTGLVRRREAEVALWELPHVKQRSATAKSI